MAPAKLKLSAMRNIMMELRKVCQHPYLASSDLENLELPEEEQQRQLVYASGKLAFLRILLPKLIERGHRVLLFSQFKIALDRIEDFLYGESYKFLRLDGDVQQAQRQKSMDAFNAPGSEYPIFLLTTRAGGVGINLATADTVIIFDPDFNPHQDLQAIARSHRYGQKKRVLVFKLMMKNTVEESIIEKTKKKLWLDNLVVQNLESKVEEEQLDDMILHGAKALYESDVNGSAPSDIQYTSKNVDELIDRVEREAEEEAKALAEKDRQAAERAARGKADNDEEKERESKEGKTKEAMSFAFAKIWEAGKDELQEVREGEGDAVEDQAAAFETIMESARLAEEKRKAEEAEKNAQRLRAKRAAIKYQADGVFSDDSPDVKKGKTKGRGKGKSKGKNCPMGSASSDADFAMPADGGSGSEDEISEFGDEEPEALVDANGRAILLPGRRKGGKLSGMSRQEMEAYAAKRAAVREQAGVLVPVEGHIPPPQMSSTAINGAQLKRDETPEARRARKDWRREEKRLMRASAQGGAALSGVNTGGITAGSSSALMDRRPSRPLSIIDAARIEKGRSVLQWLWQVFAETRMTDQLVRWGKLGILERGVETRKAEYYRLAKEADEMLHDLGQGGYFGEQEAMRSVNLLFEMRVEVVAAEPPSEPFEAEGGGRMRPRRIPEVPEGVGKWRYQREGRNGYHRSQGYEPGLDTSAGLPAPGSARLGSASVRGPLEAVPAVGPSGTASSAARSGSGLAVAPDSRPVDAALDRPPPASGTAGPSRSITPLSGTDACGVNPPSMLQVEVPPQLSRDPSASNVSRPATPTVRANGEHASCPFCRGAHQLRDCPTAPQLSALEELRASVLAAHEDSDVRRSALDEMQKLIDMRQDSGQTAAFGSASSGTQPASATDHRPPITASCTSQPPLVVDQSHAPSTTRDNTTSSSTSSLNQVRGRATQGGSLTPRTAERSGNVTPKRIDLSSGTSSAPQPVSGARPSEFGSKYAAIVVDDESGDERPRKRSKQAEGRIGVNGQNGRHGEDSAHLANGVNAKHVVNGLNDLYPSQQAMGRHDFHARPAAGGNANGSAGCALCLSAKPHDLLLCPDVLSKPECTAQALNLVSHLDPQFAILQDLYADLVNPTCAFCTQHCGFLSVRECVEAKGGRKVLKTLIRRLDPVRDETEDGPGKAMLIRRMGGLYDCYLSWPKGEAQVGSGRG